MHSPAEVCSYPAEVKRPVDAQCARYGPATLSELQAPRLRVNPGTATRQGGPDINDDAPWLCHVNIRRGVQHQTQECRPLVMPPASDTRAHRTHDGRNGVCRKTGAWPRLGQSTAPTHRALPAARCVGGRTT
jgi:hypothetical protein